MSPNISPKISQINLLRRTAALLCAAFAGVGLVAGPLRAQSPVPAPNPSPAVPTPYSSPLFHAGGALTPPSFPFPAPIPFPDPLYGQLQGTPTGLVQGTDAAGVPNGTLVSTEIPSFLLGNYVPSKPPTTPGTYFPNHFRDGSFFPWSAPLTFLTPQEVAPATSPTGATPVPNVECTPTAVNVTEFPFIKNVQYVGTQPGTASTPDTAVYAGSMIPGLHSGSAPAGSPQLIRQVVYFGRAENISTVTTTGGTPTVTNTPVGAIYCVDGYTGEVIWRYQTSSYSDGSVFSTPAVAYMNVLVSPAVGTTAAVYANKAVVIVGDNNGFVYCLDATGNGDGTSNITAATTVTGVTGLVGLPIYGAQPTYGTTTSTTVGPHVGTTSIYWAYRPDAAQPQNATQVVSGFNANSSLPVPGPFGLASPNVYIDRGVSTTPDATGKLLSNAIIYLGNTRDCVYALDGIGAANNRTAAPLPAYNLSLPPADTGIPDAVPTCNPRWWFSPDNGANSGISFESTPAVSQTASDLTATIVTANPPNQVASGGPVTFTATVVDASGNGGIPTGSVIFSIDGVAQPPPPAQPAAVTLSGGTASFTPATALTPGRHLITATYSGDANFSGSNNSPVFEEEVNSGTAATGSTVITSSANPSTPGQAVTFTATITDGTGAAAPDGIVLFSIDGAAQTPAATAAGGTATFTTTNPLSPGPHTITAAYTDSTGVVTAPATSFEQYVLGLFGPVVYIGSSQELGATSNAGRIYALNGLTGPGYATTAAGTDRTQRPLWAYPNLYASGNGSVAGPGNATTPLPVRPALGNISGSPVVFTNTDDVVPATGTVPAHPRTRIYFAADSGLEVTSGTTNTQPNPRPASDTTGRVWAIETNGTTAYTTGSTGTRVWSFPQANDPNNAALDFTPEPSPPMGAFQDATPAMGFVQFPTTIQYGPSPFTLYTHADSVRTNVRGQSVPMLYVGTNGTADLGFYGLDVDGSTDAERSIYRLESPTGSSFTSSPVLVTNSSTSGGNGGAVYATSGNTLYQFTATPISNINTAQAFPFIGVDSQFSDGSPISGPSVAAANTSDLLTNVAGASTYGGAVVNATDYVYFGDGTFGFCRGITPLDPNDGGAVPPNEFGGVTDTNPPAQYSNKFFLQAYLFNGTTNSATTRDMGQAIPLNGTISGFEWGGFAYVRIGNVVPPCPALDVAAPSANELVADPTDPTLFYGNGQAVNFSIGKSTVTVPPFKSDGVTPNTVASPTGAANESDFVQRSDTPTATATYTPPLQLASASNQKGWLAAYSYPIGGVNTRIGDTPGAFRRISQATQIATTYTKNSDGTYTATGTINLIIQTTLGSQYATGGTATTAPTGIAQTPPSEQPTFGILNPLAVEGEGKTLGSAAIQAVADNIGGAGPFGPVSSTPTTPDFAAYSNGSNHLTSLPNSGYNPATEDPTKILATLDEQAATGSTPITIATSVGQVPDGGSGDNATPGGVTPYGLEVENRSLVDNSNLTLFPALNVAMQPVRAHWNDNTSANGTTQNGPGATVNPLPWEDLSALSSVALNTSLDYPDIPASAIKHNLFPYQPASGLPSGKPGPLDINPGNPSTATLSAAVISNGRQTGTPDSIQFDYTVPAHQPANLQLWDAGRGNGAAINGPGTPTPAELASGNNIFPQGYIEGSGSGAGVNAGGGTPQRVFVDVGGHGRFTTIYPYREVENFAGVPVDMKTEITNGTVSLGNGPSALGNQTEQSPLGLFDPYNPTYRAFFQPMTVLNDGNTNLLNAQFNQQMTYNGPLALPVYADTNDLLSGFGGFDYNITSGPIASNVRTYNNSPIPLPNLPPYVSGPINEEPFIFRTSLDTDLMQAYGRNPGIVGNTNYVYQAQPIAIGSLYLGATFHKPRVGSAATTLTVPDAPDAGVAGYSLDYSPDNLPKPPTVTDPANNLPYKAVPYVGISVPFGTPVGSYATNDAQPLRLFEGQDPLPANATAAQIAERPFLPPTYGSATGGHSAPSGTLATQLPLNANAQPLLPASTGVKLNINVIEDRLTDGFTAGALPMIDAGPAGPSVAQGGGTSTPTSTPDFAPAAFRDPNTGNLSVYWTSGRIANSFGIYGVNARFNLGSNATPGNYFYPADPVGGKWWQSVGGYTGTALKPVLPISATSPVYSGLTVAEDPNNAANVSAFVVGVNPSAPYSNKLYSYPITPASGSGSAFTADAFGSGAAITPASSAGQVKYGVKGLYTSFTNPLWAFWTGATRGRTALYYNSQASGAGWGTPVLLPVPAGLTAVADASPLLMPMAPINGTLIPAIEVTYSGTAPDGNIDLYVSRYVPAGTTAATASQLDLAAFPAVTENLAAVGGWYQARDVAWSRTGALNVSVFAQGAVQSLLYNGTTPQFTKAIYDKASGLLVLTGVHVPYVTPPASPAPQFTVNTIYVDSATGRIRFSPALLPSQSFGAGQIRATFSPQARRLTTDTRADTAPATFLDEALKVNDTAAPFTNTNLAVSVKADRRWTIWRKSGAVGSAATLYYKAQRLTCFLPSPIGVTATAPYAVNLTSVTLNGTDVTNQVDVDYARGRIYFPISTGAEGETAVVKYTDSSGTSVTTPADTVQWQDEFLANDTKDVVPIDTASGLDAVIDNEVRIFNKTNENNVAAFLDPFAGVSSSHKVWLFWNSTRNGTADIYSETIDPRFAPGP